MPKDLVVDDIVIRRSRRTVLQLGRTMSLLQEALASLALADDPTVRSEAREELIGAVEAVQRGDFSRASRFARRSISISRPVGKDVKAVASDRRRLRETGAELISRTAKGIRSMRGLGIETKDSRETLKRARSLHDQGYYEESIGLLLKVTEMMAAFRELPKE